MNQLEQEARSAILLHFLLQYMCIGFLILGILCATALIFWIQSAARAQDVFSKQDFSEDQEAKKQTKGLDLQVILLSTSISSLFGELLTGIVLLKLDHATNWKPFFQLLPQYTAVIFSLSTALLGYRILLRGILWSADSSFLDTSDLREQRLQTSIGILVLFCILTLAVCFIML